MGTAEIMDQRTVSRPVFQSEEVPRANCRKESRAGKDNAGQKLWNEHEQAVTSKRGCVRDAPLPAVGGNGAANAKGG